MGGGLWRWVKDFCSEDIFCEDLVFQSVMSGSFFGLSGLLTDGKNGKELRSYAYRRPVCEISASDNEYRRMLEKIVADFDISHIYVSSLIGHSLDALCLDVPTTIIYHDYSIYCPALNIFFDSVCTECGRQDLDRCIAENPLAGLLNRNGGDYWLKLRDAFFRSADRTDLCHVAPDNSVVKNLYAIDNRFQKFHIDVIEHGIQFKQVDCFGGAEKGRKLRAIILGHLYQAKGLDVLRRVIDVLRLAVDVYLVGCSNQVGSEFADRVGVHVIGEYEHKKLTLLLDSIRPDLALILSIVPETFSYTLSELSAHGIPSCARMIGSFGERIRHQENGFLIDHADEDLIDFVLSIDADRCVVREVADRLRLQPVRGAFDMVMDYYGLRKGYLEQAYLDFVEQRLALCQK
jgi:glycosyltransferase involved in cell wall biosynthesis